MATQTDRAVKSLGCTQEIFPLVKQYYRNTFKAKEQGRLICWMTVADPVELLRAMDIMPVFPENFATACGAKQISHILCAEAEKRSFSPDLCSYFRTAYGYNLVEKELKLPYPGGGMPEPDLVLCALDGCLTQSTWMHIMARHYNVPIFIVDVPVIPARMNRYKPSSYYVEYVVSQLEEAINFLEKVSGRKMDRDRLGEIVHLSARAAALWDEILGLRRAIPCPIGGEDMNSAAAVRVLLLGTQQCVDFFQRMKKEAEERIRIKEGALPSEKYRLYVDGIPPWYSLGLFNYFHRYGAVSVVEFYSSLMCHSKINASLPPLQALARKCLANTPSQMSNREYAEEVVERCRKARVDGAIFILNRGCKPTNVKTYHTRDKVKDDLGIPTLVIEVDQTDPRDYDDARVKMRIDAFMETLEGRKRGHG